eukprot:jgi/Mesvir1/14628/Mv05298-RA.1
MNFVTAMSTRQNNKISDDADMLSLLAWGVEQGWSVSMSPDGDIVFDKGEEDDETDDVAPIACAPFVGGCESEEEEEEKPERRRRRRRTVFERKERVVLGDGKRMKLSIRVTED